MYGNWSLDTLYKGFDDPKFKNDFNNLPQMIKKSITFVKEELNTTDGAKEKIEKYIELNNEFEQYTNILEYCNLLTATNSENIEALNVLDKVEEMLSDMVVVSTLFRKFMSLLDNLDEIIASSDLLKEHEFFLHQEKKASTHMLSTEEEEIVYAKMRLTGSNAWTTLYDQLTSTLEVDINLHGEDKKLTLSAVRNLSDDKDPYVRKAAYYAELAAYPKIEKSIAAALNAIKGEAITNTKLRGYDSVLAMTLDSSRMDQETLDALLWTMKEALPMFTKYFKHKANLLGHKEGLPFYDLFAPVGNVDMTFSKEEGSAFMIKNFTDFDKELGDFAKNAIENEWVDWEPRKGKVGGAFCSNIHSIKESRVLMNYAGSFGDVLTLSHEFGHAYHGYALDDASYLNSDYSMPIAEVASIFCETLVCNAAIKTATPEEKLVILENNLQGMSQVIVDIYSRFLFESEMIEKRKEGTVSVDEMKEIMARAQKAAYLDGMTEENHPYMWLCKGHYYSAGYNFYNFPYAYGLLFAKGLYSMYLKEGSSFAKKYKALLHATGKNSLYEVGKIVGVDVRTKEFWQGAIDVIKDEIEQFISL